MHGSIDPTTQRRFFAPLPTRGLWTPLGLERGQFLLILGLACATYALFPAPVWWRVGRDDFVRIATSYGVIPIAVAVALYRNGRAHLGLFLAATATLAALKLLITAALALVVDLLPTASGS
jgi:hypothetical protein